MQRLHSLGFGTQSKQAEPITEDEKALPWSSKQFGCHSGYALLKTMYFYNCKMFGLRSMDEHRSLNCKQFQKKVDENGKVFLEYTDFGSKNNKGGLHHMKFNNKVVRQ